MTNNVFLDCWRAVHVDNRGMGWQKAATDDPKGTLRTRLAAMPITSELWKRRYPELAGIHKDEPNIPKRNLIARNICAGGLWDHIHEGIRSYQTMKNNIVREEAPDWAKLVKNDRGEPVDLRYRDPAAVAEIGFEPLPLEKMGLYEDPRRSSWPVQHEVRPVVLPE